MKKTLLLMVALVTSLFLVSCTDMKTVLEDDANDYYVTGAIANWGDAAGDEDWQMEAIARGDERVTSIKKDLKKAKYVYIFEATFPTDEAGWEVTYKIDGEEVTVDGNLTIKILQVTKGGEAPNFWGQNPESGAFRNLTPDTLYLPPFVEENVDEAGTWNDNPIVLAAGTYYVVYVQYAAADHGLALIKK